MTEASLRADLVKLNRRLQENMSAIQRLLIDNMTAREFMKNFLKDESVVEEYRSQIRKNDNMIRVKESENATIKIAMKGIENDLRQIALYGETISPSTFDAGSSSPPRSRARGGSSPRRVSSPRRSFQNIGGPSSRQRSSSRDRSSSPSRSSSLRRPSSTRQMDKGFESRSRRPKM